MRQPEARVRKRIFVIAVLAMACLSAVVIAVSWVLHDLPAIDSLEQAATRPTSFVVDRDDELLYEIIDPNTGRQVDLSLDTIPRSCINATLATEDSRFYLHIGFDPIAITRAFVQNTRAGGDIVSGGSTLTQQLVRILLLDSNERYEQSYRRKLREAYLAWRLEQRYSKDELLALYLNQSYYGNFAFGIEAAAQTFFAKPAAQLSSGECALLAGLVQYPSGYNPLVYPENAKARQLTVLRLMVDSGYLSESESAIIGGESLRFRSNLFDIRAPHFVMYVQDLATQMVGADAIRSGGLRIITTLDAELQESATMSVQRRLDQLNCRVPGLCDAKTNRNRRVDNAAAVVLDAHTGDILAMVGSPDYFEQSIQGNLNAALTQRQPGSAMKPLTYAAAMDPAWSAARGQEPLTAASIIADLPTTFYVKDENGGSAPYAPVNYDRLYHGPVSVRTALANSYNIPAVKTVDRIGVETLRTIAIQSGISSLTGDYGLALTLGGGEVSLLQLTAAYGIFQGGKRLEPHAIADIQRSDENGVWRSILKHNAMGDSSLQPQVIDARTAYLITDILSDNTARIPSFGENSALHLPFDTAAKTGTTTDWRDNWTIGYSTERITGVWVGNADNQPMLDVSGIDGAGPIWHDIMVEAHERAPAPFTRPDGLHDVTVCAPSGLLPSDACNKQIRELFIQGTEPTMVDDQFHAYTVDSRTAQVASYDTPDQYRVQRVYWDLPVEYDNWATANGIQQAPAPSPHTMLARQEIEIDSDGSGQPLQLRSPVSRTAYELHPSLPSSSQRIHIQGIAAEDQSWAMLRLVRDGEVMVEKTDTRKIDVWWPLELGNHTFAIEGQRTMDGFIYTSESAYIEVTDFSADDIAFQQADNSISN